MLNRSTKPMRRTPMKRSCGFKQGGAQFARTPMKKSRPKRRPMAERRYALACRGEPCYVRLPFFIEHPRETVVPAHSNSQQDGKGMGIKAADEKTAPACIWCHSELDQGKRLTKEERRAYWEDAYARWVPVRAVKLAGQEK